MVLAVYNLLHIIFYVYKFVYPYDTISTDCTADFEPTPIALNYTLIRNRAPAAPPPSLPSRDLALLLNEIFKFIVTIAGNSFCILNYFSCR